MNGAEAVCRAVEAAGARVAFGLPGTQLVGLYDALRRSRVRAITATHELGAAFMANGYARASGAVGTLLTIPGPGFTYAITGLAEASADSAAVVHLTAAPPKRRYAAQAIEQARLAAFVAKATIEVARADRAGPAVWEAFALARSGEPGPVVVQLAAVALQGRARGRPEQPKPFRQPRAPAGNDVLATAERLAAARRPVLLLGQGSAGAAGQVRELVRRTGAAVLASTSGRGVIPESDPAVLSADTPGAPPTANQLLDAADLVLAIGCKLAHNATSGFALRLAPERLIHVDASEEVLGANYPASLEIAADAGLFLDELLAAVVTRPSSWRRRELERLQLRAAAATALPEPRFRGVPGGSAQAFFAALGRALPPDGRLLLDSGLHQYLARRHFRVQTPLGLIAPTGFQSMGFAIPAAIGARLARPDEPAVALLGDGGLALSGLELTTAVREGVPLTAVVLNDGALGLIRLQQLASQGREHATRLGSLDLGALAASIGARYRRIEGDPEQTLSEAIRSDDVVLVEVVLDPMRTRGLALRGRLARHRPTARRDG